MVANPNGADTPVGVWLNADVGAQAPDSKTGRKQVKAGGKGTQGGSGSLAFRPGWHLGETPLATQFDRLNPETGVKELFPENFVWAECDIAADIDYQEEAMSYGYTKNGKFQHSLAGLPKLPVDGYYKYRTNPNPETVPWLITGAMKVNRLLGDDEVNAILTEKGIAPKQRQGGNKTLADLGLEQVTETENKNTAHIDGVKFMENPDYKNEIDTWYNSGRADDESFILGTTSATLQGLGAMETDVLIASEKINIIFRDHPEMSIDDIKAIPEIINNPYLILKSLNADNVKMNSRIVVFGSRKASNKKPVLVVFDLAPEQDKIDITDYQKVNSAYTKTTHPVDFVSNSEVLYVTPNTKKATSLLHAIGFNMPILWNDSGYIGSISRRKKTVNIKGKKFSDVIQNNGIFFSERDGLEADEGTEQNIAKLVSFFSGGGTVDAKLKENLTTYLQQIAVVEKDEKISKAYALNENGDVIGLGESIDVRDFLKKHKFKEGEINAFHASPSCCNFSSLRNNPDQPIDELTAIATADFINQVKPKVFTLENVAAYAKSQSLRHITKALAENGYRFRIGTYQASQFGAAANRRRMFLVTTIDGDITPMTPYLVKSTGWLEMFGFVFDESDIDKLYRCIVQE